MSLNREASEQLLLNVLQLLSETGEPDVVHTTEQPPTVSYLWQLELPVPAALAFTVFLESLDVLDIEGGLLQAGQLGQINGFSLSVVNISA